MNGFVELAMGPLAGLECRRALGRRWVRVVQVIAGLPSLAVVLVVLWIWWFSQTFDQSYMPGGVLRGGVITLEGMLLVVALVLSPAAVAGTLAGEKARGILPLLLASSVSTREIVTGRLAGRLALVAVFLLVSFPAVCLLAGYAALPMVVVVCLALLPAMVSFGVGGLALFASAISRRARDALLAVYLLELLLFLTPVFGIRLLPPAFWAMLGPINPFYGLWSLVESAELLPTVKSCLIWGSVGLIGLSLASWQLRRVYLRQVAGDRPRSGRRQRERPPVGDDPMLWKEIHFERVERFSRLVWWLGFLIFSVLIAITLVLLVIIFWNRWVRPDNGWVVWATGQLEMWVGSTALPLSWLIQWTIALRAAVAVASEREHGTWDSLLLSSLEGREIVRAKIWGSLYSLRGFIAAAAVVWTGAAVVEALELGLYFAILANTVVVSVFITAVGVWISLSTSTATRAMTFTIGTWLAAAGGFAALAGLIVGVIMLVIVMAWMYWLTMSGRLLFTGGRTAGPPFPISFATAWTLTRLALYAGSAMLIIPIFRYRFDRLAGRTPGS